MDSSSDFKMDKTPFSVALLADADDEKAYWLSRTPQERLRAVEEIKQTLYGYIFADARLQRVFEIAQRELS